jgi:hypothetical protein
MATKKKFLITLLTIMVLLSASGMTGFHSAMNLVSPKVRITRVVHDSFVNFRVENFPSNVYVEVLIGAHGTHGVDGVKVGTFLTTRSGSLRASVNIPSSFHGANELDLRVQRKGYNGTNRTDYYSYASFSNKGSGGSQNGNLIKIQVLSVIKDTSVTFKAINLPPGVLFEVDLFTLTRKFSDAKVIGSFNSGAGGDLVLTFNIPSSFDGRNQIFLFINSHSAGYRGITSFRN